MTITTPVAFLIFNRPDLTRLVFEAIAKVKPKKLFVVADGPRFPEEAEKCELARSVIDKIDWECKVSKNFSNKNLGCGRRISSGIDWVFSSVDEAIFLEDDCLPIESFFLFCQELLERYRDDKRIMAIGGNNFQSGQKRSAFSYHFSKYSGCWGWASWRRAWHHYDYEMKTWPAFKQAGMMKMICPDPHEQRFWTKLFDSMHENPLGIDTWDHQWKYACWSQNGLAIEPSVNLVANIGLGRPDASHTKESDPLFAELSKAQDLWEIRHPPFVVRHHDADNHIFDFFVEDKQLKKNDALLGKFRRSVSMICEKAKAAFNS